jgi:hypothetical protein
LVIFKVLGILNTFADAMEIKKRHFFIPIVVFVIIVSVTAVYFYFFRLRNTALPAFNAIPDSAALIFETNNPFRFWSTLSATDLWKELTAVDEINKLDSTITWLDSLIHSDEKALSLINGSRIIVSVHPNADDRPAMLYICELPDPAKSGQIRKFIDRSCPACQQKFMTYANKTIFSVTLPSMANKFYYTLTRGLVIISFHPVLIEQAIDQIKTGQPLDTDSVFSELRNAAGKNASANIFINNNQLPLLLSLIINDEYSGQTKYFKNFAGWSEFDLNITGREWVMNGFTSASGTSGNYLEIFKDQTGEVSDLPHVLPYNTAFFLSTRINDYGNFLDRFKAQLKAADSLFTYEQIINSLITQKTVDIEKEMANWGINEIGMAVIENRTPPDSNLILAIGIGNPEECARDLRSLTDTSMDIKNKKGRQTDTDMRMIMKLTASIPFAYSLKPFLPDLCPEYYYILDNYILFSFNEAALKHVVFSHQNGRTLANDDNFDTFAINLSESNIILCYLNVRRSLELAKSMVHSNLLTVLEKNRESFRKIEGLSIQYNFLNRFFYSNVFLMYNPDFKEDENYIWRTELDSVVEAGPFLFDNPLTGKMMVIVSDKSDNLYMLDETGHILWKNKIPSPVLGKIYQISSSKKNEVSYIFNTADQLYVIDVDGFIKDGYPVQLKVSATNGMLLADFDRNKTYRLLYNGEDGLIHNIDLHGKATAGWKAPATESQVSRSLQYLYTGKEDVIIVPIDDGSVIMTDRKGTVKFQSDANTAFADHSDFYVNRTNSKGSIITTLVNGDLAYIQGKNCSITSFRNFSAAHFFIYEDITGDQDPDFIFIDSTDLYVFNRFKKQIFTYYFEQLVRDKPVVITLPSKEKILGVVTRDDEKVYLFNRNGLMEACAGIKGDTPFCIGSLNNDKVNNLVIGRGKMVCCYQLPMINDQ